MKINFPVSPYSPIVEIGEKISSLEKSSGLKFLGLHRGVMNVCKIDLLTASQIDYNDTQLHQYGKNDGDSNLISSIKEKFGMKNHQIVITPGGMPAIDLIIDCISDKKFWIPQYHWTPWSEILKINKKEIHTFDDFKLEKFEPKEGVVMLCYPSNPTGWSPPMSVLRDFIQKCNRNEVTVILDIPYYNLYHPDNSEISNMFLENVIVLSSFSKSLGLSGFRVGYISTLNKTLYEAVRIKSLYKYNSVSNIPQKIIYNLLSQENTISEYRNNTVFHITQNIKYLIENDLLWSEYPSYPIGPFAIINFSYDKLIENQISSVPLDKFTLSNSEIKDHVRISLAVDSKEFKSYFVKILEKVSS